MASPQRKPTARSVKPLEAGAQGGVVLPLPVSASAPERDQRSITAEGRAQPERIGDILKRERDRRGDDLQQIADYLCIRRTFLTAIENSRYEEFPADAYVIGFLRSYAEYLGLDGKEAIDYYRYEMAGRRNKPSLMLPTPLSEGRTPSAVILIAAAVAAILIYALWYGLSSSDRAVVVSPPPMPAASSAEPTAPAGAVAPATANNATNSPPLAQLAPVVASEAAAPTSIRLPTTATTTINPVSLPTQTSPLKPVVPRVVIRADQTSWVLVTTVAGKTLFDKVMKMGDVYDVPDMPGLSLTTGNGSGITLVVDGVEQPKLSTGPSHVVRNIPLSAQTLRAFPSQVAE